MIDYERTDGCRMQFLQLALDDPGAEPCECCDSCAGAWYPAAIADEATGSVSAALNRAGFAVEPRQLWPTGADRLSVPVKGRIPAGEQVAPGRALARLTDLGWGGRLRELLAPDAPDAPCPPDVVEACVSVLSEWGWERRPDTVVSAPSRRRPVFTASLAQALAEIGRLPSLGALGMRRAATASGPAGTALSGSPACGRPSTRASWRFRLVGWCCSWTT